MMEALLAMHDWEGAVLLGNSRAVLRGNSRAVLRENSTAELKSNTSVAISNNKIFISETAIVIKASVINAKEA